MKRRVRHRGVRGEPIGGRRGSPRRRGCVGDHRARRRGRRRAGGRNRKSETVTETEKDRRLFGLRLRENHDASRGRRHDHVHTVRVRVSFPLLSTCPFPSDVHLPVRLADDDDEGESFGVVSREDERFDERDVGERSARIGVLSESDAGGFHRRRPREDGDAVDAVMVREREPRRAQIAPERRRRGGDDARRVEKRVRANTRGAPKSPGVGDEHASPAISGRRRHANDAVRVDAAHAEGTRAGDDAVDARDGRERREG